MTNIMTVTSKAEWSYRNGRTGERDDYEHRDSRLKELYDEGYELVTSIAATDSDGEIRRIVDTLVKRL